MAMYLLHCVRMLGTKKPANAVVIKQTTYFTGLSPSIMPDTVVAVSAASCFSNCTKA
jgi:hypothetical protein